MMPDARRQAVEQPLEVGRRFAGLDSIRFVAAAWVALSHIGVAPLPDRIANSHGLLRVLVGLYHSMFCGPAAVMVFFILSGLVIHAPYATGERLQPARFLTRRLVRILIPLLVAATVARLRSLEGLSLVVWSLHAELVYYALYPIVLAVRRRVGWTPWMVGSSLFAVGLIAFHRDCVFPWQLGPLLTWAFGFPVWLSGCMLAEHWRSSSSLQRFASHRWLLRALAWSSSAATVALHFHGGVPYIVTLLPFSVIAWGWLAAELVHFNGLRPGPPAWLESAGAWSYSLYLTHTLIAEEWSRHWPGHGAAWVGCWAIVFAGAYLFYLLIERPAHRLARTISPGARPRER